MKRPKPKPPPLAIPRLGSLLHRLQHAPQPKEGEPYLDRLMIFLEDPPPGVRDRWKQGAKICTKWGIPCTGPSIWRLYRAYALEWRLRLAQEAIATSETPESLEEQAAHLIALRTVEVLADPRSPPACLVGLARIELRKRNLAFAREKHQDAKRTKLDRALDALADEMGKNPAADAAFNQFTATLDPEGLLADQP